MRGSRAARVKSHDTKEQEQQSNEMGLNACSIFVTDCLFENVMSLFLCSPTMEQATGKTMSFELIMREEAVYAPWGRRDAIRICTCVTDDLVPPLRQSITSQG